MAASTASIISNSSKPVFVVGASSSCSSGKSVSNNFANGFIGAPLKGFVSKRGKIVNVSAKVRAVAVAIATPVVEETKDVMKLPTWAEFELGRAPVFWKTMNGLPPTSGEKLTIFYNPSATKLVPNEEYGVAFNGGFNQPIMCGSEPRTMLRKIRGKADPPMFSINICVPKHALSLIFSFTNGVEWDGPYKVQFQVAKAWRNKPIEFFNEGLAHELGRDGACEQAIYPDSGIVITRCAMLGNLSVEGGDRCNLDFVLGCTDPSSPSFNPLANVDDGSCPSYSDSEE